MEDSSLNISQVFRQQWRLILVVMLIFTCLCALFIYQHKPVYRASVMLAPLTELDPSFQNVSLMDYFELSGKRNFNLTELYQFFSSIVISTGVKQLFYTQVYLPSLEQSQRDKRLYEYFAKMYDVQLYMEDKQRKYLVSTRDKNAQKAIERLNNYIAFANKYAFAQIAINVANRKKMIQSELLLPFTPRKADFYQNDNSSLSSRLFNFLSIAYEKNDMPVKPPLTQPPIVELFQYDSPIILYSTQLNPKLTKTLSLGVFGGLILGFFVGVFRIGLQRALKST